MKKRVFSPKALAAMRRSAANARRVKALATEARRNSLGDVQAPAASHLNEVEHRDAMELRLYRRFFNLLEEIIRGRN